MPPLENGKDRTKTGVPNPSIINHESELNRMRAIGSRELFIEFLKARVPRTAVARLRLLCAFDITGCTLAVFLQSALPNQVVFAAQCWDNPDEESALQDRTGGSYKGNC